MIIGSNCLIALLKREQTMKINHFLGLYENCSTVRWKNHWHRNDFQLCYLGLITLSSMIQFLICKMEAQNKNMLLWGLNNIVDGKHWTWQRVMVSVCPSPSPVQPNWVNWERMQCFPVRVFQMRRKIYFIINAVNVYWETLQCATLCCQALGIQWRTSPSLLNLTLCRKWPALVDERASLWYSRCRRKHR